jgi:putative ABC transport system permease protein
MDLIIGACGLGLAYAALALGVFITFRIFRFPDITVDGSFTLGAALCAVLAAGGVPLPAALATAVAGGLAAGAVTGLVHTRLGAGALLSGILTMTALYSVNLRVMGRPNMALPRPAGGGPDSEPFFLVTHLLVALAVWGLLALLFRTDLGLALRASGSNPTMLAAVGGRVAGMKVAGVALANGLCALSGGLVARHQGFADVNMGFGMIVLGLASVFLGEALAGRRRLPLTLAGVVLGAVLFRLLISLALASGAAPRDLKLLTALFVLGALVFSRTARRAATGQQEEGS